MKLEASTNTNKKLLFDKEREGILLIISSSHDRHKKDKKKHSHKERSKYNR
jgi:hypothetical protein